MNVEVQDWRLVRSVKNGVLRSIINGQLVSESFSNVQVADLLGFGIQHETIEFRYALSSLWRDGVLYPVGGNGNKWALTINDVQEAKEWLGESLYQRTRLEKSAVGYICRNGSQYGRRGQFQKDLAMAKAELLKLERTPLSPQTDFAIAEGRYHENLIASFGFLSANGVAGYTNQILSALRFFPFSEDDCKKLILNHREIFKALRDRETEGAKSLVDAQARKWLEVSKR